MEFKELGSVALAAFLCSATFPIGIAKAGETLAGRATIIDGDTLRIRGMVIGLSGIAAPSLDQVCEAKSGPVPCGREVARTLADRIGDAVITCEARGLDRSNRTLALCRLDDEDLGAWLVSSGLAVSDRFSDTTYFDHETKAWAKRRGLWAGVFEDPVGRPREDYAFAAKPTASGADPGDKSVNGIGLFRLSRLAK